MKVLIRNSNTEIIETNPYWDYVQEEYLLPDGTPAPYYYVRSRHSSIAIPQLDNGLFVLVKQFRYLGGRTGIEFPGGGRKSGHSAEKTAYEEMREEAGITEAKLEFIGTFNPCVGITDEVCSVYYASALQLSDPQPERSEEIEVIFATDEEISKFIAQGDIWNGMSLAAWALFRLRGL